MDAYTSFAAVYDEFMDNVPYQEWGDFIQEKLKEQHITEGILLDLGCGTGSMTEVLSDKGFDMIGVDGSEDMLQIAMDKRGERDILYLLQDMREFELYGTVRAVVSVCDCVNYILEPEDLLRVFRLVNNYLDPGGIFFFDFNTDHKYRLMGDQTFAESREDASFIWENYYDEESRINEYGLTIFVQKDGDQYERFAEEHYQKGYTLTEIRQLLDEAGLEFITAYDEYTESYPLNQSQRICVVAREHTKTCDQDL